MVSPRWCCATLTPPGSTRSPPRWAPPPAPSNRRTARWSTLMPPSWRHRAAGMPRWRWSWWPRTRRWSPAPTPSTTSRRCSSSAPKQKPATSPSVVGAAFAPGLTCVLARLAGQGMAKVDEVHVARVGTGGPSCARHHHRSLGGVGIDWRDGGWVRRPAGSGRELCWFPEPIGAEDCYRAALPDALLLVPAFPGVARVTARLAANRRDRLTARMPMLRPPHPEGGLGAVRTEVRGERDQGRSVQVLGAMDRPAVAAGAVAALSAVWAADGRLRPTRSGRSGVTRRAASVPRGPGSPGREGGGVRGRLSPQPDHVR